MVYGSQVVPNIEESEEVRDREFAEIWFNIGQLKCSDTSLDHSWGWITTDQGFGLIIPSNCKLKSSSLEVTSYIYNIPWDYYDEVNDIYAYYSNYGRIDIYDDYTERNEYFSLKITDGFSGYDANQVNSTGVPVIVGGFTYTSNYISKLNNDIKNKTSYYWETPLHYVIKIAK
jgi:hypothetical protein